MTSSFASCKATAPGMFIKHCWQTEGSPEYRWEYILPKGEIEIIFSFGEPLHYQRAALEGLTSRCFINGISNTPVRLLIPSHQCFFGVVLQPASVKKLLNAPSGVFLNCITDVELVNKEMGALWYQLAEVKGFEERAHLVQQWVHKRLCTIHQQELALSGFLDSCHEVVSVAGLAAHVCYSTRQLHRKSQELFGMSSEMLLGYKRYKQALQLLHHSKQTLTRIAHECGFYDQAHFNHEFKEYTQLTPGAYREQRSHLPAHLYL